VAKKKVHKFEQATPEQIKAFTEAIEKDWRGTFVPGEEIALHDANRRPISTGSTKLDWALTKPFVEGTINEIHGPNGVGKTTFALEVAANATLMNKMVFFFDIERKLVDSQVAMIPRLNRDLFLRVRPDTGEDAVNRVHRCVSEVPGCVIIFDSITQMLPEVEDASGAGDMQRAAVAKLTAKMIRKILGPVERNRCMILFISHETANMDMYSGKVKTKGGEAVPDAAAQRIRLKALSTGKIKNPSGDIVGQNVKCRVVKNNQGLPFKEVEVPLIYGCGIDRSLDLLQVAVDLAVIEKSGGWYTMVWEGKPTKMYKEPMLEQLRDNKPYRDFIVSKVNEVL
jgi:recombination protein RecA